MIDLGGRVRTVLLKAGLSLTNSCVDNGAAEQSGQPVHRVKHAVVDVASRPRRQVPRVNERPHPVAALEHGGLAAPQRRVPLIIVDLAAIL